MGSPQDSRPNTRSAAQEKVKQASASLEKNPFHALDNSIDHTERTSPSGNNEQSGITQDDAKPLKSSGANCSTQPPTGGSKRAKKRWRKKQQSTAGQTDGELANNRAPNNCPVGDSTEGSAIENNVTEDDATQDSAAAVTATVNNAATVTNPTDKGSGDIWPADNQTSNINPVDGGSKDHSQASQQDASVLVDIFNDFSGIPRKLYARRRLIYFIGKWPIFYYILWMLASHAAVLFVNGIGRSVEPYCGTPIIGNMIPFFCHDPGEAPIYDAANLTAKVMSSQEELGRVMDSVGENHEMARDMSKHEVALRDLKVRVAASKLRRKTELVEELARLIKSTDEVTWAISGFTAKVNKATDVIVAIDEDAVDKLAAIEDRPSRPPPSPQQAVLNSIIDPFSAFRLTDVALTENDVKEIFLGATIQVASRIPPCLSEAFELHGLFKEIQSTVDRIGELAADEIGELPQMAVLASLWSQLAQADEFAEHKSHKELLGDLQGFYKTMAERTGEMISTLKTVHSELGDFRDEWASPSLVMRDLPLKVIMNMMRKSTLRIESGRKMLEQIEGRGRREMVHATTL